VREPILLRVPCVLGAAVVAGGLGTALTPRWSPVGGVLWAAAWGFGVALVSVLDVALTTRALGGRPFAIAATVLIAVPIDALLVTVVGAAGAVAVAWASRSLRRRGPRVEVVVPPARITTPAIEAGSAKP
jgi:hypothetical protein